MTCISLMVALIGGIVTVLITNPSPVGAVKCYVCNSEVPDGKECSKGGKSLEKYKMDCNYAPDGNNQFLTTVFGDLEDGGLGPKDMKDLSGSTSMGWTKMKPEKRVDNVNVTEHHIFKNLYLTKSKDGKSISKMPPYDTCRTLVITAPETTLSTKDNKDAKMPSSTRTIRLCGWKHVSSIEAGDCKEYKGKGGKTNMCTCNTDLCNDKAGVSGIMSTPKWIFMLFAITCMATFS